MIRIALAVVAAVGLTFAADAATSYVHHVRAHHRVGGGDAYHGMVSGVGPLCQTPNGGLVVCSFGGGVSEVGPLCQTPNGGLVVCSSRYGGGGVAEVGPLCQTPNGALVVCYSR